MLGHLSDPGEDIRECLRHAEDCEHQAREQFDAGLRQGFLDAARQWLFLARSYERAGAFTSAVGFTSAVDLPQIHS
jgi:hypothetical protein